MKKFRPLTPEELMKCFRDKKLFYPVGFPDENYIIGTIDIDYKTYNVEVTLHSLNIEIERYVINQLEFLRNWRFADGSPCGVEMGKRNQEGK